ncbi:MAG: YihY/virulence factor BrkB family protein [SAR202 cluster bacterium]|nr:YihY/virulence factor BrkB family protein [SAR202 cluster bacterium]
MSLITIATYFAKFIQFCAGAFNEFLGKNGPYMAAAISFYSFFSVFPLFIATVAFMGWILGSNRVSDWLVTEIPKQLPVGQELIAGVLRTVDEQKIIGSVVALGALFWASTAVFGAIRKSINNIWGIRRTRPFLQERLMDFSLMFGASSLLLLSIFTTTFPDAIQRFLNNLFQDGAPFVAGFLGRIAIAMPWIAVFPTFLILYKWLPNTRVRLREAWLPAIAAGAVFELATVAFVEFLRTFPATLDLYGAVSAVLALLAWVYVSSIILLAGALGTSRYTAFLAKVEQKQRVKELSRNLERIRSQPLELANPE